MPPHGGLGLCAERAFSTFSLTYMDVQASIESPPLDMCITRHASVLRQHSAFVEAWHHLLSLGVLLMQVLQQTSDTAGRGGLELVHTAVHALVGTCFPSGNLPSSLGSESDKRVLLLDSSSGLRHSPFLRGVANPFSWRFEQHTGPSCLQPCVWYTTDQKLN